jgi:hypothetical protein
MNKFQHYNLSQTCIYSTMTGPLTTLNFSILAACDTAGTAILLGNSQIELYRFNAEGVKKTKHAGVGFQVSGAGVRTGSRSDWVLSGRGKEVKR